MSAVILMHPCAQRGIQPRRSADRFSILGDVRRIALCKGCNRAQQTIIVQLADCWLDEPITVDEVLRRVRAKVAEMLKPSGPEAA